MVAWARDLSVGRAEWKGHRKPYRVKGMLYILTVMMVTLGVYIFA